MVHSSQLELIPKLLMHTRHCSIPKKRDPRINSHTGSPSSLTIKSFIHNILLSCQLKFYSYYLQDSSLTTLDIWPNATLRWRRGDVIVTVSTIARQLSHKALKSHRICLFYNIQLYPYLVIPCVYVNLISLFNICQNGVFRSESLK